MQLPSAPAIVSRVLFGFSIKLVEQRKAEKYLCNNKKKMMAQSNIKSSRSFKIVIFSDCQSEHFIINRTYIEMLLGKKKKKKKKKPQSTLEYPFIVFFRSYLLDVPF